jgi:hypothetical protein
MRHGIDLKPIHNVKDAGNSRWPAETGSRVFISGAVDGLVEPIGIEPMTSSLQS